MGARISRFRERLAGKIAARGDRKARRHLLAARTTRLNIWEMLDEGPVRIPGVTPDSVIRKAEATAQRYKRKAQRHERKAGRISRRHEWLAEKIRGSRPKET